MSSTNVLSIALIILTPASYVPQYHRLLGLRSSIGISVAATCLSTVVAQAQVVNMYYLFKSAPVMREGVPIATPPSTRDWLNLTQVLVQWGCSLLSYGLVIIFPDTTANNNSSSSAADTGIAKTVSTTLLILHAILSLLAIPVGGRQEDTVFNILRNINAGIATPFFTLGGVAGFIAQALTTWRAPQEPNALSKSTLVLQIFVFPFLALLWPFRLILPQNMWRHERAVLLSWYPWVGWACVNSAVTAVGQAIVLYVSWQARGGSLHLAGERQPLLST